MTGAGHVARFQRSWDPFEGTGTLAFETIEGAHVFAWQDQPAATCAAIAKFLRGVR